MFKKIGKFLNEKVVKPIDKVVVKPIDKAIVKPIREVTDKEYALREETAALERAKERYVASRPEFFSARQTLELTRSEYEKVVEDFRSTHGEAAARTHVPQIHDPGVPEDPAEGALKVMKDIEKGTRIVLKTISLGLTESFWNRHEIPEARAYLVNKTREFNRATKRLNDATADMIKAIRTLEKATVQVQLRHAELGEDATASDAQVHEARLQAQIDIVRRLLNDAHDPDAIAEMTGFDRQIIDRAALIPSS